MPGAIAIKIGIALISPCANPISKVRPELINCGILSSSPWINVSINVIAVGTSIGSCAAIPSISPDSILNPPAKSAGRLAVIANIRLLRSSAPSSINAGNASTIPLHRLVIISGPFVIIISSNPSISSPYAWCNRPKPATTSPIPAPIPMNLRNPSPKLAAFLSTSSKDSPTIDPHVPI